MHTERQTQIIQISMELIANKGIQGFTIKNLSKEIGISEPAIYRHFNNKTAILVSILDNFKEIAGESSFDVTSHTSALEIIDARFTMMLDVFTKQPTIIAVLFSEEIFKNDTILKEKILEIQNNNQSKIEDIISQGQADNNVRKDIDKSTFALLIMGAFRLLVKRWYLNDYNFNLKEEGIKLIHSFKLIIN